MEALRINRYIAHCGLCSRREAGEWVKQGRVKVNGVICTDVSRKIGESDKVEVDGKSIQIQNFVYILLNKPRGYLSTTSDDRGRDTVMDLVKVSEKLYPVGRLDLETTGLLLLTNDGALKQRLSHPSYEVQKVYQVRLDKNLLEVDLNIIVSGFDLEDGKVQVDALSWVEGKGRDVVALAIHSGRNRIVRRIFENFGYKIRKLDRIQFAGLTKKGLPRGKWRKLDEKEILFLKHLSGPKSEKEKP